jgi:hypothetical protein
MRAGSAYDSLPNRVISSIDLRRSFHSGNYPRISSFRRQTNSCAKRAGPSNLAKPSARAKHSAVAGCSLTPLPQKLGIKPGMIVVTIDPPEDYRKLLDPLPSGVNFATRPVGNTKFVHLFVTRRSQLTNQLSILRRKIADDATLWVSWPKKSSGVATDITEDVIRAVALPLGFVDIKVCAVDEIWSGLKLMIRRENRKSK